MKDLWVSGAETRLAEPKRPTPQIWAVLVLNSAVRGGREYTMRHTGTLRPGFTDFHKVYRAYVGRDLPPPGRRSRMPDQLARVVEFEASLTHRIVRAVRAAAKLQAERE